MGFLDRLRGLLGGHKAQAKQGADKAAGGADEKTGGSYSDQIDSVSEKTKESIDTLGDDA